MRSRREKNLGGEGIWSENDICGAGGVLDGGSGERADMERCVGAEEFRLCELKGQNFGVGEREFDGWLRSVECGFDERFFKDQKVACDCWHRGCKQDRQAED